MEINNIFKPKCSMLIDQNKYIDNGMGGVDPLGHVCYNDAMYTDGVHFYCKECQEAIASGNSEHITMPPCNTVQAWSAVCKQKDMPKEYIKIINNNFWDLI